MNIDKFWLEKELTDKFNTLTLHTIVNEAFISALPFDKESLNDSDIEALSQYSLGVIKKLGGFDLVTNAMESCNNLHRGFFLKDLYLICNTSAMEAMKRIRDDEAVLKKDRSESEAIVDEAAFTDREYKSFVSSANSLNLDKISEIIEKKTIDVLKKEKEEYQKEEETNQRLMDAYANIKGEDAATEESLDSLISEAIPIGKAKQYVSLFSTIQSNAMNAVMVFESNTTDFPIKAVEHVTQYNFLDSVKEPQSNISKLKDMVPSVAIESYFDCEDKGVIMDKAMVVAITVYTMFETLKTMGLYSPSIKEVESYILDKNKRYIGENAIKDEIKNIVSSVVSEINAITKPDTLLDKRGEIEEVKSLIEDNNFITDKSPVLESLCEALDQVENRIISLNVSEPEEEKEIDMYEKRRTEVDLSSINKLYSTMALDPYVEKIRFKFEKDGYNCPPDIVVEGLMADGNCKKQNTVSMEAYSSIANPKEYTKNLIKQSKLSESTKSVEFYTTLIGTTEKIM